MSLGDYFIKIGNDKLNNMYIAKESYQADLQLQSAGSYQDANGQVHQDYFPYKRLAVSFNTCNMTEQMVEAFANWWKSRFDEGTEDVTVTCWVPKINSYVTQKVTVSGITPILNTLSSRHTAIYNGFRITLTGRGGST